MSRYALVVDGVVTNVVAAGTAPALPGQWVHDAGGTAARGDLYSNGVFTRPAPVVLRHITRLAFLSRFSDAEAVAIDLASIGGTQQAAALRRYMSKVNAALYIDLDRADTRSGVQALETATLLGAGRALEILDAAIEPHERA